MPINFTLIERRNLIAALGNGRHSAITAARLANILGYPTTGNQVQLRSLIKECIEIDGDLIGAVTGRPAGFFKISTLLELNNYVDSLERRTRSDNTRRTALINNYNTRYPAHGTNRTTLTII